MGPEAQLERKVRQAVTAAGGLCLKLTALPGIPDRLLILPEYEIRTGQSMGKTEVLTETLRLITRPRFIFVEMKAQGGRVSTIQKARIAQLRELGADVRVVTGPEETEALIAEIKGGDST